MPRESEYTARGPTYSDKLAESQAGIQRRLNSAATWQAWGGVLSGIASIGSAAGKVYKDWNKP